MPVTANDLRALFLGYFQQHGHSVVASSPLVPHNDPTLLFTNAGMVQFKNVFTGVEKRPYSRAATAQKCVRAGGKHNDLDNVGYTARHHTFFEMLGNFSFGDYFKDSAIELAWDLVTRQLGLSPERLWVTVYPDDDQAADLWRKIAGIPEERIVRHPENFWQMGDTGPCGPCSEIFYDQGPELAGGPPGSPDEDGDRYLEFWNLVFTQYEQQPDGSRVPLPRPSVDTGMGLERITALLQGVHDNYDIDLFQALIRASEELTGTRAEGKARPSHKVIADHLRAAAFLVADGVMPANDGRGYVLRRIMRRGMRHAHLLGAREPLLWRLVPTLTAEMGKAYPELVRAESLIVEILKLEETSFRRTLERGLRLLEEETQGMAPGASLPGGTAFRLYDTYGFPLDLTQDALRAQGRTVDLAGFDAAMARQRTAARAAWKGSGESALEPVWFDILDAVGPTEFLGYHADRAEARVQALVVDGRRVAQVPPGTEVLVVTNQTPFYAEAGGQEGDTGTMRAGAMRLEVTDTRKKLGALYGHVGRVEGVALHEGDEVELVIDSVRRQRLRRAHSATHLLHAALRRHLGTHVTQKGSLVAADRLRFDFSHPKPLRDDELALVEAEVNHHLRRNEPTAVKLMARDDAIGAGAMALFGEKYGDEVRVVSMGTEGGTGPGEAAHPYSVELCGGTHVGRTGDIAFFRILAETAVAAGVRRIEALTGEAAFIQARAEHELLRDLASTLKAAPAQLPAKLEALVDERRRLERELADSRRQLAAGGAGATAVKEIAGIRFAGRVVEGLPAKELRGTVDAIRKDVGAGIVALVAVNDGKASLIVGLSDDLIGRFDAVELLRRGVAEVGGSGGGGRRNFAQGGGPDGSRAAAALAAIEAGLAA